MTSRREARRRPQPEPSFPALASYVGDRNDPVAMVEWAEARLAYLAAGHDEPLPHIKSLDRYAMRVRGVWRSEFR